MSSNVNESMHTGPQHHLHSDNEPLPGSKGGAATVDYTPETINQTRLPPSEEGTTQNLTPHTETHPKSLDALNIPQQSEGTQRETVKPSMGDKIIGKTQEIAGKVMRNRQLQEKGAGRAQGKIIT